MGRLIAATLALAMGVVATLGLAACGSGSDAKLLQGNTAQEITENLDAVKQLAAEKECVSAEDAAQQVATQVDGLKDIDPKLKETLEKGAVKLNEVVARCSEEEEEDQEAAEFEEEEPEATEAEEEPKKKPDKNEEETSEEPTKEPKTEKETGPPVEPPEPPGHGGEPPPGHEEGGGTPSGGIGPGAEAQGEGGEEGGD